MHNSLPGCELSAIAWANSDPTLHACRATGVAHLRGWIGPGDPAHSGGHRQGGAADAAAGFAGRRGQAAAPEGAATPASITGGFCAPCLTPQ